LFDLSDPASTRANRRESPIPAGDDDKEQAGAVHQLDAPEAVELHHRMLDSYTRELDRQEENREQQAVDEDFYDNIQWRDEDATALKNRGQVPLVYNVIATAVNWVLGTERRGRSDFHVLPRRKEDSKPAERKSQILKYLSDCNRTGFHRSRAFADAVKVGIGWLEDCVEDEGDGEPITARYESWRNMLWDSAAQALDLSDARYVFRSKWVDLDIGKALFASRSGILEMAARDAEPLVLSGEYGDEAMDRAELEMERIGSPSRMPNRFQRQRVRIIEGWYRKPEEVKRLSGGMFAGEIFDEHSRGHVDAVNSGEAEIVERMVMRVHAVLMTVNGILWHGPSPYRHNRFPFTPIWGNRRGRDGMPYGMIRGLRDINEDINKRASKALQLLVENRVVVDEGASDDMDELQEEVSRPDAFIVKKAGKEIKFADQRELSDAHSNIMQRNIMMVQQASGVTDENLGRKTNASSGIAIERRQEQGSLATAHFFDHLRLAYQIQGEKQLSLVEQFMGEKKQFRITNMRGKPEYITVNDGMPDNDIVRSKADFVITEGDWRVTMRQAAAAELMDLMVKLAPAQPQLVMVMLDLVIESTDIPNREEIVRRVRELSGMRDPDAEEPTQEEMARAQAADAKAALEQAGAEATVRKLVAEALRAEAQGKKALADALRANVASMGGPKRGAIDIVADVMSAPAIAPPADELMRDLGLVTRTEQEYVAQAAAEAADQQQQAMQAQQMADAEAAQAPTQQTQPEQPQPVGLGSTVNRSRPAAPGPNEPPQGA